MPSLTIDGRAVTVDPGRTVLDACRAAGARVPTLCDDPDLAPYGACRLCIVKIDGLRGMPTACTTAAADGMKVCTDDEDLRAARAMTVQLLLSDHPQDCLTCAQNGRCGLQDVAAGLGIRERLFRPLDRPAVRDDSNPCFAVEPAKCVFCGKCVRACTEINGCGAIDLLGRGFKTRVAPFGEVPLRESICESCGECVERCPTGALASRRFPPPDREVSTVCPYCGVGCRILLGVRGGAIRSRADRGRLRPGGCLSACACVRPSGRDRPGPRTAPGGRAGSRGSGRVCGADRRRLAGRARRAEAAGCAGSPRLGRRATGAGHVARTDRT
ncbi:MAG: 2Fe-2S iron-sulfur cluster-binding protein, partial [Myxococcota bacterium]|nr:2Fe-2S iron-sulfur cluster-binding protein [Myxococcota bacterium]